MNHPNKIILILLTFLCLTAAAQQRPATVRDMMRLLEERHDISFVYESELDVDVVHIGSRPNSEDVDKDLRKVFKGSGIDWKRTGRYVVLTPSKPREIDFEPQERYDTLTASWVTSDKFRRARTQTGLKAIDGERFKKGYAALSSPDLIKTLQSYSGVSTGTELVSGLYVHGGTGRDNLFLLDGVPLYQVSHLAGLFSSFNTDIIENVDFYKSGFPARFGGRLSSVVDVTTKDGDFHDYHGSFSIGLLDGRLQYEGPIIKGKTSFNVSVRRSWIDLLAYPTLAIINSTTENKTDVSYYFQDLNAKVTHKFSDDDILSLNVFSGNDALKYRFTDIQEEKARSSNDIRMGWGNVLSSLNWKSRVNDGFSYSAVLYYTRSLSSLNYLNDTYYSTDNRAHMTLDDVSAKADFLWRPHRRHTLRFGGQYTFHRYAPEQTVTMTNRPDTGGTTVYLAHESGVYVEDEMNLLDWLDLTAGLRYSLFAVNGKIWNGLEPRVAANFRINERMALKASYVEMNQYTHGLATTSIDLPTNLWLPATEKVKPMHSRQSAAEFIMNLPKNVHVELGGFYRTLDNIYEYNGVNLFCPSITGWEKDFSEGRGRAYGVEAAAGWNNAKIETNIYYTLSWIERKFDDFYYDWYYDRNDCRHKLTVDMSYRINERIDLYASWNYHTGNRVTIADQFIGLEYLGGYSPRYEMFYSEPNNMKIPDYHRLDVGANFRKTTKRGNERVWNVSLYNAYCRLNPFMVVDYSIGQEGGKPYAKLTGVFPIIPSFSYTLKF